MTGVNKAELRRLCEDAPHGEFELQTGCSWRRIGMKGDGDILRPVIHQHDGWPDLCAADGMLEFIAGCTPAKVQALLDECDRKDSPLEEYKRGGRCALELLEDAESERDAALAELEQLRRNASALMFMELTSEIVAIRSQLQSCRREAELYRWVSRGVQEAETLVSVVLCHGGDAAKIAERIATYMEANQEVRNG